jgi:nicotinate-nucleotide adenylyltransferase
MARVLSAALPSCHACGVKIGILGGTFDPVHVGHLVIADQARNQLALDEVLFIPAGEPWRKADRAITSAEHRLAMLRLAIDGNEAFAISDIELRRPGPSYTADTLAQLAGERLDDEFWFIVGADALADMRNWHEPERIFHHARVAAAPREGHGVEAYELAEGALAKHSDRIDRFGCPYIGVSSTDIRERVSAGRAIRYLVPDAVADYIANHALYRR